MSYTCNAPILFLVFNRPNVTAQVFKAIRAAKPEKLYLACDGPRSGNPSDVAKVAEVRRIVSGIDWPCETFTLFRDKNLGCGRGVSSAINWFFEHEVEGIILEDDCLPDPSFFNYCVWALNAYREDERVWHISGNNFLTPIRYFKGQPVGFVTLPQVWGWATWRDRWEHYIFDANELSRQTGKCCDAWQLRPKSKQYKFKNIESLKQGFDTWDYQWQIVVLNNGGLVAVPSANLITNLGMGADATHTRSSKDWRQCMPVGEWNYVGPPVVPEMNKQMNAHFEGCMGMASLLQRIVRKLKRF